MCAKLSIQNQFFIRFFSLLWNHFDSFHFEWIFWKIPCHNLWKFLLLSFWNYVNGISKKKSIFAFDFNILHFKISHLVWYLFMSSLIFINFELKRFFMDVNFILCAVFSLLILPVVIVLECDRFRYTHAAWILPLLNKTHSFRSHFRFSLCRHNTTGLLFCTEFQSNTRRFHGRIYR